MSDKCLDYPPWMSAIFRRMIGAAYHRCRLSAGHDGLHVNNEGRTWPAQAKATP